MKKNNSWAVFALAAILAYVILMGWNTKQSSGRTHSFDYITAAGGIIGPSQTIKPSPAFLSIGSVVAGATASLFYIESEDLIASPDTIVLGGGLGYEGNFPGGIDSLACLSIASGAEYSIEVTN